MPITIAQFFQALIMVAECLFEPIRSPLFMFAMFHVVDANFKIFQRDVFLSVHDDRKASIRVLYQRNPRICVQTKIESLSKVSKRFRDVTVRGHVTIVQKFEREQTVTQMERGEEEMNSLRLALAV